MINDFALVNIDNPHTVVGSRSEYTLIDTPSVLENGERLSVLSDGILRYNDKFELINELKASITINTSSDEFSIRLVGKKQDDANYGPINDITVSGSKTPPEGSVTLNVSANVEMNTRCSFGLEVQNLAGTEDIEVIQFTLTV